jgi:hypothetical protein
MIGKPDWFKRRKYTGWGITPANWKGWAYIGGIILVIFIIQFLLPLSQKIKTITTYAWVLLIVLDVIHIMVNLKNDEREARIEAISERNVAWVMISVLAICIFYESIRTALIGGTPVVDPLLLIVLGAGLLTKIISNIVLERTM